MNLFFEYVLNTFNNLNDIKIKGYTLKFIL